MDKLTAAWRREITPREECQIALLRKKVEIAKDNLRNFERPIRDRYMKRLQRERRKNDA